MNHSLLKSRQNEFAERLLDWFDEHGRHNLPWQGAGAYAVWVSEIMLQQTQVTTVLPYYAKFMARFPDVKTLADAPEDDVLSHWAGLGYYNRARNLQRAAQLVRDEHAGEFPDDFESVIALPGIGRSTAAAILAQAFGQQQAILDGNVKRILVRQFMVPGWPGSPKVQTVLWQHAESLTAECPVDRVADYTQAIMDLGALLCKRRAPLCQECPVSETCQAFLANAVAQYPSSKPKKLKPVKQTKMLVCRQGNEVLLIKRPATGIWPSLWSLPEAMPDAQLDEAVQQLGLRLLSQQPLPAFRHTFTHYHLDIEPVLCEVASSMVQDAPAQMWHNTRAASDGLPAWPAPVDKIVNKYLSKP